MFGELKVEDSVITTNNFDKMCRTCLSTREIQSIYVLKFDETPVLDLLDSCASIQVLKYY